MLHSGHWSSLVFTLLSVQTVHCCVNNGDFNCSRKWYFWFGVFWGFIVLLVGSIAIYNRQCRGNRVACGGRRRGRRNQKKRHPGSITGTLSSTTSQTTAVTVVTASQVVIPITQPGHHHDNVGVRPDSRMNQSTGLLSTTTNLDQDTQSPRVITSPTPAS